MKKYGVILLLLCFFISVSLAYADGQEGSSGTFILPSGVKIVDDEAFFGTAVEVVILQENVESIGENAFAENERLSDIYIPESTTYIADNALSENDSTIHGIAGSYADQWAQKHKVKFVHEDIWVAIGQTSNLLRKLQAEYPFIGFAGCLMLLIGLMAKSMCTRQQRRKKIHPEMYAIDLAFP